MERKVRVGIIGCGGIANNKHMPSLSAIAAVEMVAFCDIIPSVPQRQQRSTVPQMPRPTPTTMNF